MYKIIFYTYFLYLWISILNMKKWEEIKLQMEQKKSNGFF